MFFSESDGVRLIPLVIVALLQRISEPHRAVQRKKSNIPRGQALLSTSVVSLELATSYQGRSYALVLDPGAFPVTPLNLTETGR